VSRWKIVAIGIKLQALVNGKSSIINDFAVHENLAPEQMDSIPWHSNHALHKMLLRMHRITKNDYVSAMNFRVRHHPVPDASRPVMDFIYQQVITDKQRVFHRFRRNLKGLRKEGDYKNRKHNGRAEPLQAA